MNEWFKDYRCQKIIIHQKDYPWILRSESTINCINFMLLLAVNCKSKVFSINHNTLQR